MSAGLKKTKELEELGVVSSYTSVEEAPTTHELFGGGCQAVVLCFLTLSSLFSIALGGSLSVGGVS